MRTSRLVVALAGALAIVPLSARAQDLGGLVSPGRLAKAHAKLEGLGNCQKCHEPGKRVTAEKCLACHRPVAERIAAKKGVHKDAGAECASCHAEHAGEDAELRPFDTRTFDHAKETGFALSGLHAGLECARCHAGRSFLAARAACASCHKDVHEGALGADCASCHPVTARFKETRRAFDHARTAFALTGAHAPLKCEACHANGRFRGVKFASCADCHKDPHRTPLGTCATCHTTDTFRTIARASAPAAPGAPVPSHGAFDHAKTGYALLGRHAAVPCAACHREPAAKVRLAHGRCADCHRDVHAGVFGTEDCARCHTEKGFKDAAFDHAVRTRFRLEGKHAPLACAACHKPPAGAPAAARVVDFRGARSECASCHADVHGGRLGTSCATCHSAVTFRVETYRHASSPEFFAGSHAGVACAKCHREETPSARVRNFKGVPFVCASCHKDPHLGQVGNDCASCHAVDTPKFAVVRFDHSRTRYPLDGKHAGLACQKCHRSETSTFPAGAGTAVRLTGISTDCRTCHSDVHLGQLGAECASCHTTRTFAVTSYRHRNAALASFFTSKHATAACKDCHRSESGDFPAGRGTTLRFAGLPASECARCHDDPHRGALGADCATCHGAASWRTASRAFHKGTTFPLEGRHLATPCASCHWNGVFAGTPRTCFDCHWVRRQDDRYRTLLGQDCSQCHRPVSWTAPVWSHAAQTGFALSAAHARLRCEQCHANGTFVGTQADCFSCHGADYRNARSPDHVSAGFPTSCDFCHRPSDASWRASSFGHSAFPLVGAHAGAVCATCHNPPYAPSAGNYTAVPTSCVGCHRRDYDTATTPVNHVAGGFPTACDTCHKVSDASWLAATFTHTRYPLVGVHATTSCTTCHNPPYAPSASNFTSVPTTCVGCHQAAFTGASSPVNHLGLPANCESCHRSGDPNWHASSAFNHASYFPLAGAHVSAPCSQCHNPPYAPSANDFANVPTSPCAACHQRDYNGATAPLNHVSAALPTTCDSCHKFSDPSWSAATFTHSTFPLAGVHATTACAVCHNPPYAPSAANYTAVPTSPCAACHQRDYDNATAPVNHVSAAFPTTCDSCHKFSDPSWSAATFTHSTFPLAGVHATTACAVCHNPPYAPSATNYTAVPTSCSGCHQSAATTATTPVNHAGLPTTCDSCHKNGDPNWLAASAFTHGTYFALAGAHASAPCSQCHNPPYAPSPNNFASVPTSPCAACHQRDYQNATSPVNHVAAGFPTTCDTCHKFADPNWLAATFSHTSFPLAGVHATTACTVCHNPPYAPSASNYSDVPTTCSGCHLSAALTATTPVNHAGLPTTCDSCHKNSDPTWLAASAFAHGAYFPLAGAHASAPCSQCHNPPYAPSANNFTSVPKSPCSACHLSSYQTATSPINHVAAGFPTTCDTCHKFSDPTWLAASFAHTAFPLVGAHATTACTVCHNPPYAPSANNYSSVPTSCYGCHQSVLAGATSPVNHAGLPTACESCHRASDAAWTVASAFAHGTYFALAGAHATAPCAQCHNPPYAPSPNNFTSVPKSPCSACHLSSYQTATSPVNHVAAGFPTTCETCHKFSDTSWLQGVFNHTWFPTSHGGAGGVCATCHTNSTNYTIFTCTGCHGQAATNSQHVGIAGYVWQSTACLSCHPTGGGGGNIRPRRRR